MPCIISRRCNPTHPTTCQTQHSIHTTVCLRLTISPIAPSPSSPRRRRLSVRHREVLIRWHLPAPARKAGRGLGTRSAAATLDACRALLADHLSYGDRWGNPPAGA
ncbi:unnamed protein product [Pleuronectes platessa]|uniref:Uncharacterized protein n=1 Tax=Pleuronectes platessa TaxID=8262 RepID=A0A9N7UC65_PLEPL|nr:unnamed protein product [Pleuronectes platessa]